MRFSRALLALAALMFSLAGHAAFPDKPIKLIIGFSPGGPLDTHARLLVDKLQQSLGQPVIVDYKAGAGGSIGADFVAKSPADGYTLLVANTGTMVINPPLYTNLPYQTLRDFSPVARTAQQPLALVVNNDVPVKTLAEFIAYARKNPGKVNYGSAGNGGISHLVPEMLKQATGIDMLHVPYKGTSPAFVDLLAGQVQFMAESIPQVSQYVKSGKVRALALTAAERNSALPDVPTMAEAGVGDVNVGLWSGFFVPAGTPPEVVRKLDTEIRRIMQLADVKERFKAMATPIRVLGSAEFARLIDAETKVWAEVGQRANVKLAY